METCYLSLAVINLQCNLQSSWSPRPLLRGKSSVWIWPSSHYRLNEAQVSVSAYWSAELSSRWIGPLLIGSVCKPILPSPQNIETNSLFNVKERSLKCAADSTDVNIKLLQNVWPRNESDVFKYCFKFWKRRVVTPVGSTFASRHWSKSSAKYCIRPGIMWWVRRAMTRIKSTSSPIKPCLSALWQRISDQRPRLPLPLETWKWECWVLTGPLRSYIERLWVLDAQNWRFLCSVWFLHFKRIICFAIPHQSSTVVVCWALGTHQ